MKHVSRFSLLLPLALFIAAVMQDMTILSGAVPVQQALYLREYFIIFALVLSMPLIYMQKWASDRNVLRGLRSLFFLVVFTFLLLLYSNNRLDKLHQAFENGELIYSNFGGYLFILSWTFFSTIFVFITLGTLRNLIYIKRKRWTSNNFTWLLICMILYPTFSMPQLLKSDLYIRTGAIINNILLFVLIVWIVINAMRVGWINYLNRKQKIACFWGGLFLLSFQIVFNFTFHKVNPVALFSPVLGKFVEMGILLLTVYLSFAMLALLAHLPTAHLYERKMKQITSLHDLSRAVNTEFDPEKLVVTIVRLATEVTDADFGWLELVDSKTSQVTMVSAKNLSNTEKNQRKPSLLDPLCEYLRIQKQPLLSNQVSKVGKIGPFVHAWKKDLNSLMAVPLLAGDKIVGFLYAGKRLEYAFEQEDADMLRAFAEQAVIALENARLVEESIVKERLEQELKIAHEAQMKLLPKFMPTLPGFEFDAVCVTANQVGGDYYDFFRLSESRLGMVVGDVSGNGAAAAFYMAEVKGMIEALASEELPPRELLVRTNRRLYENFDRSMFISLVYGILDADKKSFTFCRAGHCPVLVTSPQADSCEKLEPKGLGLGLTEGELFRQTLEEKKIRLKKGDVVLIYTDGVVEARNDRDEEFGEQHLVQIFHTMREKSSKEIKQRIIHEIYTFFDGQNAQDDLSFVVFKVI